jgi:AraC-like DNA-binding protein
MAKPEPKSALHVMAIDCCEHILERLRRALGSRLTAIGAEETPLAEREERFDLIVVGVPSYPIRRLFISDLRRAFPRIPLLVLRRDPTGEGEAIHGEFILSDVESEEDLDVVRRVRRFLPFPPCIHTQRTEHYEILRRVMRVIAEQYRDPKLNLPKVARALHISPVRLSRILNQEVGISFRQLLRQTRIEEAKRMLASSRYSVKEVAARVGFSDSHYFSRSFKEVTGVNASEYRKADGNSVRAAF